MVASLGAASVADVVIPLMTLLSVGAATLIGGHAQWIELRQAQNWPGWLLVPLTIVAMDAANWLAHYADHRFDALWRFHALHHSHPSDTREVILADCLVAGDAVLGKQNLSFYQIMSGLPAGTADPGRHGRGPRGRVPVGRDHLRAGPRGVRRPADQLADDPAPARRRTVAVIPHDFAGEAGSWGKLTCEKQVRIRQAVPSSPGIGSLACSRCRAAAPSLGATRSR